MPRAAPTKTECLRPYARGVAGGEEVGEAITERGGGGNHGGDEVMEGCPRILCGRGCPRFLWELLLIGRPTTAIL